MFIQKIWQEKHWDDTKIKKEINFLTDPCIDHTLYEIASDFDSSAVYIAENERKTSWAEQRQNNIALLKDIIQWSETGLAGKRRSFWLDEARQVAAIHILDDGMQSVYFLLDFSQEKPDHPQQPMLRGVRNLLAFRHSLVQRFARDFSNDLMPNYVQTKVNKGRLSRKNGWGHASDRKLDFQMDHLGSGYAIEPEHTFEQVMQTYADQICGHLYPSMPSGRICLFIVTLTSRKRPPFPMTNSKSFMEKNCLKGEISLGRAYRFF